MGTYHLTENEEERKSLAMDTLLYCGKALTTIIEIIMGHSITELTEYEKEVFERHQCGHNILQTIDEKCHIDITDAARILHNYYSAEGKNNEPGYGKLYKRIIKEKYSTENDDIDDESDINGFDEKEFNIELNNMFKREQQSLEAVCDDRNQKLVHNPELIDMIQIGRWIDDIMETLHRYKNRVEFLSNYDEQFRDNKKRYINTINSLYEEATELRSRCYVKSSEDEKVVELWFSKNIYVASNEKKDTFPMLIEDMAQNWYVGIQHLRYPEFAEEFLIFIKEVFYGKNRKTVIDYEKEYKKLLETKEDSIEESMQYLSILLLLYPQLTGIYWKGIMYSEEKFASIVLQTLVKHPKDWKLEDKIDTLKYRMCNLQTWDETDSTKRGVGIDLLLLCKKQILSRHYNGIDDVKGEELALKFEGCVQDSIFRSETGNVAKKDFLYIGGSETIERAKNDYDNIIFTFLELISYMRKQVTYSLPIKIKDEKFYRKFNKPQSFRSFFERFIAEAKNIDEVADLVYKLRDDNNLIWFINKSELYLGKEE